MAQQTSARWARGHDDREVSPWAISGTIFAAVMMIMVGAFHVIAGLTAVFRDNFYAVAPNYLLSNVTGWGWIHFILGGVLILAGLSIFSGRAWARGVGILVVLLSAIANFLFIPYYPFWSLLMVAVDVFVIWSLATVGRRASTY